MYILDTLEDCICLARVFLLSTQRTAYDGLTFNTLKTTTRWHVP